LGKSGEKNVREATIILGNYIEYIIKMVEALLSPILVDILEILTFIYLI